MQIHLDFREFFDLLNSKRIDYLIVGGYAVGFHGAPRFTGDIDVLVRPASETVGRLLEALDCFGFPTDPDSAEYLLENHKILQMGLPPVQIHVMTRVSGISWEQAWESRVPANYDGIPVNYIGLQPLLANKAASGRMKDLADVKALRRIQPKS